MNFLRLDPSIPVTVTSRGGAKGAAIALQDPGEEAHLRWVVVMDATGEVWVVPNPEVRVRPNWTLGRMRP